MLRRLVRRTAPLGAADVERPAVVLAPHPDDETLGCGGLVAMKRAAGAPVTVVFMTDGASSHTGLMDHDELAAHRRVEAVDACRILGVEGDNVVFLPFGDGALAASMEAAADRVAEVVAASAAEQLILPHPHEPPSDHAVVADIADRALARLGRGAQALMFPVWMWDQWPWTNPLAPPRERSSRKQILRTALMGRLGFGLVGSMTHRHDIGTVLDRKCSAIKAHATQMVRPDARSDWLTLSDIAGGEWLEQLLSPTEFYAVRSIGHPRPAGVS